MEEEWRRELAARRRRTRGSLGWLGWMTGGVLFGLLLLPALAAGLHLEETFRGLDRAFMPSATLGDRSLEILLAVCQGPGPIAERHPQYAPYVWAAGAVGWALLGLIASAIGAWAGGPSKGAGM